MFLHSAPILTSDKQRGGDIAVPFFFAMRRLDYPLICGRFIGCGSSRTMIAILTKNKPVGPSVNPALELQMSSKQNIPLIAAFILVVLALAMPLSAPSAFAQEGTPASTDAKPEATTEEIPPPPKAIPPADIVSRERPRRPVWPPFVKALPLVIPAGA